MCSYVCVHIYIYIYICYTHRERERFREALSGARVHVDLGVTGALGVEGEVEELALIVITIIIIIELV